jgi:uroporphyrinogen-III synthase
MVNVAERLKAPGVVIAAVGETTAAALEDLLGQKADIVAEPPTGEGLAQAIIAKAAPTTLLSVGGNRTTGGLKRLLVERGFEVCELAVYENFQPKLAPLTLDRPAIVVFASPSATETFFAVNSGLKETINCVAIGPTTKESLVKLGAKNISMASQPTADEMFGVIIKLTESGGGT